MKPFLCIDLTEDKKNEQFNGKEFLVAEPPAEMSESFESGVEEMLDTLNEAKLPLLPGIIQFVCGAASALLAVSIVRSLSDVSVTTAYNNAPWAFWICGICLIVWGVLAFMSHKKQKTVLEATETSAALSKMKSDENAIYGELGVPSGAIETDILWFFYKEKDGKIKPCEKGLQMCPYFNGIFRVYTESDTLYIANLDGKYAFPLSDITAFRKVKKSIVMNDWNKEDDVNSEKYKPYKLTKDQYDLVHCKYYCILEVNRASQTYGIYIPCYEEPVFESLTGIKAREE